MNATIAEDGRKKVAVVSHERSGTHFTMNTLAMNFGYVSDPWWNLDLEQGVNFHAPPAIRKYLARAHDVSVLNVLKSHHAAGFLEAIAQYVTEQFHIFYVCRDPRDTMVSFWKHIRSLPWDEGPRTESPGSFARAEPSGGILRYQKRQAASMVHRWVDHVNGWLDLAQAWPKGISVVRYEDLNLHFEKTVLGFGNRLGMVADAFRRPEKDRNVIGSGEGKVRAFPDSLSEEDQDFIMSVAGPTKERMDLLYSA
jgi:hypothetical protein